MVGYHALHDSHALSIHLSIDRSIDLPIYLSAYLRSTMKIWKDWPGNIAIEIDFTRMSIAESPTIEPAKEDQPDDPPTPW